MTTTTTPRSGPILATLFAGMFVMGGGELLMAGVLDLVAADIDVTVSTAGTLVTSYALGLAVGGPILAAVTIRLDRRTVLLGSFAVFALASLVTALAGDYTAILAARTVTGAMEGLALAAAFTVATAVVPRHQAGRAMAVVISGITVSTAIGVPAGAAAGQLLGWRGTYLAVAALSVITLVAATVLVRSVPHSGESAAGQARHAFAPRVLAVLGVCALVFAATLAALTYIVPFLNQVTGVTGAGISVFLFAYGAAAAIGSFGAGRFADTHAATTVTVTVAGVAVSLTGLYVFGANAVLAAAALVLLGAFTMGAAPVLQYRVVELAGPGGDLAQSLPASAANLGIAIGSAAGGLAIAGFSVSAAVVTGLVIAAVALPVAWVSGFWNPPTPATPPRTADTETVDAHA